MVHSLSQFALVGSATPDVANFHSAATGIVQTYLGDSTFSSEQQAERRNALAMVLLAQNPWAEVVYTSPSVFRMPSATFKKPQMVILRPRLECSVVAFDLARLSDVSGFYVPLPPYHCIRMKLRGSQTSIKFAREGFATEYVVEAPSGVSVSCLSCNSHYASTGRLRYGDRIQVETQVFVLGSVFDGNALPSSHGDPHLHFAEGGSADFRGRNHTYYALLSAPGIQFAAQTHDVTFLLPRPQLVQGSFWTDAAWTVRGVSGRVYGIAITASRVGFEVVDVATQRSIQSVRSIWKQWWEDGVRAVYKQSTIYVRASGWEVNATRKPVYNFVSGSHRWRLDLSMRKLDGTIFAHRHNASSATCFPHGIIAQSWDGDHIGIDGAKDDYTYRADRPVITTHANAEGAIEGNASHYELRAAYDLSFRYSRFHRALSDRCAPRNVSALLGVRYKERFDRLVVDVATSTEIGEW